MASSTGPSRHPARRSRVGVGCRQAAHLLLHSAEPCHRAPHALEANLGRMDQILTPIQDAIGSFLSNPIIHLLFQAVLVYYVILWLAASY